MEPEIYSKNLIVDLTFKFSLSIISYCELLTAERKFVLAKQLLRSGTSIGANIIEAQNAESRADFIHKMKIASKEAGETQYWLLLCQNSSNYPSPKELIEKLSVIIKILGKIVITARKW